MEREVCKPPRIHHVHMGVAQIQQERLRRFWPLFPLTRVPFWFQFFEPQPYYGFALFDGIDLHEAVRL